MATDLERAQKIVDRHNRLIGFAGMMPANIATEVAEGIAVGRREGLGLAAKAIAEQIVRLPRQSSN